METQYKIIGGDGREYGPATINELKSWIRDGRVAGATPIWRSDTGLWSPAAQVPEIRADLTQIVLAAGLAAAASARPAGFWTRAGARIVDEIVLSIIASLLWPLVAHLTHWTIPADLPPDSQPIVTYEQAMEHLRQMLGYFQQMAPLFLLTQSIRCVYEIFLNGTYGATLGKMAVGARIVRVDGSRIGYGIATGRWLGAILSDTICFIGDLFVAFREDKRALHDLLAGTRVILVR